MTIHFPSETDTRTRLSDARPGVLKRVRGRQRRGRVAVVGGVLLAASCATAATAVVTQAGRVGIETGVTCYSHDDLNSFSTTAAMSQQRGTVVRVADLATKQQMCALAWKGGLKQAAADRGKPTNIDPNTSTLTVPPLAMCALPDGSTGGFLIETPATSAAQGCDRLGLALLH